ncbi:single-stranded DNA-binding protein [Actinomadura sp. NPDC048955]|uniref:single-stranded DNA-binding protein n=1 Tax=Actinomadura sp. NPDC048955 TaxID=3158228 RepID=UPI0033DBB5FD
MITLRGHLVENPSLKFTASGVAYSTFRIASTAAKFDPESGAWKDVDTVFMNCIAWRILAENVAESLQRGDRAIVVGRLKQSSYQTGDGQNRISNEVEAEDVAPSLRTATAKITKIQRRTGGQPSDRSWENTGGQSSQPVPAGGFDSGQAWSAPAAVGAGFSDDPPF